MINKIQTKLYFLSLSIFIILIDQFTKYLMFYNYKIFINKDFLLFRLDFVKNYGAAFNIFSGSRIFLSLISILFSILLIYLIIGLYISPVFYEGGSIGYLLTPNFGYLLGTYPLIKIIDKLNKRNKINIGNFFKKGFLAIGAMHLTGIFYNFIQVIFYSEFNIFLYNLGKYSVGKIGYHFLMLFPLLLLIKPIEVLKHSK